MTAALDPSYFGFREVVEDMLKPGLLRYGYGVEAGYPMPAFAEGPAADPQSWKLVPGALVFVTVGGGPGLTHEGTFDRTFVVVRTIGPQHDEDAAKRLAAANDRVLLDYEYSQRVGSWWLLGVSRTGGPPSLALRDNGERYHYAASYIAHVGTGR